MAKPKRGKKSTALSAGAELPAAVDSLFAKVATILDRARVGVVRSVNSEMLLAYWHIGREIVEALQGGLERAAYGTALIETLAERLTRQYGQGFSSTNLRYFRSFFQVYADRLPEIRHAPCGESGNDRTAGAIRHTARGVLNDLSLAAEKAEGIRGFSALLGWTHYRALMSVENRAARLFYELEAEKDGWSVRHLERQIHTLLFARLLKSRNKAGLLDLAVLGEVVETDDLVAVSEQVLD